MPCCMPWPSLRVCVCQAAAPDNLPLTSPHLTRRRLVGSHMRHTQEGYEGGTCSPRCDTNCSGHGRCDAPDTCACFRGWSGEQCDEAVCHKCFHGSCAAPDTCTCRTHYHGAVLHAHPVARLCRRGASAACSSSGVEERGGELGSTAGPACDVYCDRHGEYIGDHLSQGLKYAHTHANTHTSCRCPRRAWPRWLTRERFGCRGLSRAESARVRQSKCRCHAGWTGEFCTEVYMHCLAIEATPPVLRGHYCWSPMGLEASALLSASC